MLPDGPRPNPIWAERIDTDSSSPILQFMFASTGAEGALPRFDDTAGEQGLSQTPMGPTPDMGQTGVYICVCVGHKQSHQQWVISPTADMGQTGDCNETPTV